MVFTDISDDSVYDVIKKIRYNKFIDIHELEYLGDACFYFFIFWLFNVFSELVIMSFRSSRASGWSSRGCEACSREDYAVTGHQGMLLLILLIN